MTSFRAVRVSDHALLRYLERVKGVDVEAARAEVAEIIGGAAFLGAPSVTRDGHIYTIADYTVKTVLPKNGRQSFRAGERAMHPKPQGSASR